MKNKLEYRIENGSLIIDNYFNNLKIGSVNGGSVENILNKCKLYDEEYEILLKENEYMKHIAKDFEQLQQKNKQLKERIEYLERSNNRREDTILEQRQKISDLEDNWNKLKEDLINDINYWQEQEKEWIKLGFIKFGGEANNKIIFKKVLGKIQELEQGSDSNVKD